MVLLGPSDSWVTHFLRVAKLPLSWFCLLVLPTMYVQGKLGLLSSQGGADVPPPQPSLWDWLIWKEGSAFYRVEWTSCFFPKNELRTLDIGPGKEAWMLTVYCSSFVCVCVLRYFWCGPIFKSLLNLLQYCFCFLCFGFLAERHVGS